MPHFTMNQLPCWISSLGLLLCLTVCTCRALTIYGFEGRDVTLPCKYDSHYNGICDICWMRGSIPNNGCGTQIIYANGDGAVVARDNVRYQLNGALKKGDASLTILKARKSDSGNYGCRVHVPGWFNDIKIEVYLEIRKAPQRPSTTLGYVTTTTHIATHAPVLTTQYEATTIPEHVTTKHTETEQMYTTLGYVTTTTLIPTKGPVLTTQDETTTIPEHVTTKHTGPVLTTQDEMTIVPEHMTTKHTGPVLTTQDEMTIVPEHMTTKHTGPVLTTQDEMTIVPEHMTTKHPVVITETYPGLSSRGRFKPVNEDTDVLPAILAPVILVLLVLGIFAVYLISKHKRRFRATLEIAKNSSTFVSYSNLDSSVTLPMTNSANI